MLMDWNPKSTPTPTPALWDWDNIDPGYGGGGPVHSSSSISASIGSSSPYAGITRPALDLDPASLAQQDQPIGLKLGKRIYFEDVSVANGGGGGKNPSASSASSSPSAAAAVLVKRSRVSNQSIQTFYCQVEGCKVDLAGSKDYHRRHRVCESHSKCPLVIIAGQERRFCQQCSRFHDLSAFDDKKRSCRKRLSDHNARRRKPQPECMLSPPFYDDRQQMNLSLNRAPFGQIRLSGTSTWEGSCDFKLAHMKGSWVKSTNGLPDTNLSNALLTRRHDLDRLLPFRGTTAEVLNQGDQEASVVASNLNGAPNIRRALSLLSTDSWVPADGAGQTASLAQLLQTNNQTSAPQPVISSASRCWHDEQPPAQRGQALAFSVHSDGNQFQLLKAPYETTFFDYSQIH